MLVLGPTFDVEHARPPQFDISGLCGVEFVRQSACVVGMGLLWKKSSSNTQGGCGVPAVGGVGQGDATEHIPLALTGLKSLNVLQIHYVYSPAALRRQTESGVATGVQPRQVHEEGTAWFHGPDERRGGAGEAKAVSATKKHQLNAGF